MTVRMKYVTFICALLCMALHATAQTTEEAKGRLFIIGGNQTPEIVERFVSLSGGANANILVIPFAGGASGDVQATGASLAEKFRGLGCMADFVFFEKGEADLAENLAKLEGVTGVYFSGGSQSKHTSMLLGTNFLERIKEIYRQGGVVGGSSAGAAVMSKIMITGQDTVNTEPFTSIKEGSVVTPEGFGFIDYAIIDQHFIQRKRVNRLLSVVIQHQLPGIGIDEATGVIVSGDGTFEVFGDRSVMVLEPRFTAPPHSDAHGNLGTKGEGITLRIFLSGDRFTLNQLKTNQ